MSTKALAAMTRTAAALVAVLLATAGGAAAAPALWKVADADSTVYLFGTMHAVPRDLAWRTPALDAAFAAADEAWFELDLFGDPTAGFLYMATRGTSPDRPLSSRLPPADRARLAAAAARAGLSPAALEGLQPWLASVALTDGAALKEGFTAYGPDLALTLEARRTGKPVKGFETGADQVALFTSMPEAAQMDLLRQTLDEIDGGPAALRKLAGAWVAGDLLDVRTLEPGGIRPEDEGTYKALLVDRNRRFADGIAGILAGAGTAFVAIGAAHLAADDDSVQHFLAAKGYTVERVE